MSRRGADPTSAVNGRPAVLRETETSQAVRRWSRLSSCSPSSPRRIASPCPRANARCFAVTSPAVSHPLCRLDGMSSYRFPTGYEALGQVRQQVHSGCNHAHRRRRRGVLQPSALTVVSEALPGRVRLLGGFARRAEPVVRGLRQGGVGSPTAATSSRSDSRCDPWKGDKT